MRSPFAMNSRSEWKIDSSQVTQIPKQTSFLKSLEIEDDFDGFFDGRRSWFFLLDVTKRIMIGGF